MAAMDRFLDKAIIAACCLAVCGCILAESGATAQSLAAPDSQTLTLALAMLAAFACSAIFEIAPAPWNALAPSAYCLAALACGQAAAFIPLAAYDFARCVFRPDVSRASGLLALIAFAACMAHQALPPVAAAVLACMTMAAAALSARTSSAEARQRIAHRTQDALKSQAIGLRDKNRNLAEALEKLEGEKADGGTNPNGASPIGGHIAGHNGGCIVGPKGFASPTPNASESSARAVNPPRPAAFACLTEREWEVARLVADGLDNREIAAEAYLSEGTVRNNISTILSKMGLKNRTQLAITFWKGRGN